MFPGLGWAVPHSCGPSSRRGRWSRIAWCTCPVFAAHCRWVTCVLSHLTPHRQLLQRLPHMAALGLCSEWARTEAAHTRGPRARTTSHPPCSVIGQSHRVARFRRRGCRPHCMMMSGEVTLQRSMGRLLVTVRKQPVTRSVSQAH